MASTDPLKHASQDLEPFSQDNSNVDPLHESNPLASSRRIGLPYVPPPVGRLHVHIVEARDLRPSPAPYVVCSFEGNDALCTLDSPGVRDSSQEIGSFGYDGVEEQGGTLEKVTRARWDHVVVFDVFNSHSMLHVTLYDYSDDETFLGSVKIGCISMLPWTTEWFKLERRESSEDTVSGEISLAVKYHRVGKEESWHGREDFSTLKLIAQGKYGVVRLVREKNTARLYAMKVLSKGPLQASRETNAIYPPAIGSFIARVKFIFETSTDIRVAADYKWGGELLRHLPSAGVFPEERAKFYLAELVLAFEFLHKQNFAVLVRPENILLDAHGHISLSYFGISRRYPRPRDRGNYEAVEYCAPETLLRDEYAADMADFWSLGVLAFEMCCGWSPFYAENPQQTLRNITYGKVRYPRESLGTDGGNFIKRLLQRNPNIRLGSTNGARDLKEHSFFHGMDWNALSNYRSVPPFKPKLKPLLENYPFPDFESTLNPFDRTAMASPHVGAFVEESNMHAKVWTAGSNSDSEGDVEKRNGQAGGGQRGEDDWLSGDLELDLDSERETLEEVTHTMENSKLPTPGPSFSSTTDWLSLVDTAPTVTVKFPSSSASFEEKSVPKAAVGGSTTSLKESTLFQNPVLDPYSKGHDIKLTDTAAKFKGFGLFDNLQALKGFGSPQTPGSADFQSPSSYKTAWSRLGSAPLHSVMSSGSESWARSTYATPPSGLSSLVGRQSTTQSGPSTTYQKLLHDRGLLPPPLKEVDWSGRGQHVEFQMSEEIPLKPLAAIGRGGSALVDSVLCRRIKLARKIMTCNRRQKLQTVINEVEHLQRLQHPHIVQLIGSYLQGKTFSILLYPVADYNLTTFLEAVEVSFGPSHQTTEYDTHYSPRDELEKFFHCLAHAVAYIHDNVTKHMDIKPQNVLVRRSPISAGGGYRVYLADFGISKRFSSDELSQTDGVIERTKKYCAPEVYRWETRGRAADIFSLGCVFLEMQTVYQAKTLDEFADFRARGAKEEGERDDEDDDDGDESFHGNILRLQLWIDKLKKRGYYNDEKKDRRLEIIRQMLLEDPGARPRAPEILSQLGGPKPCCLKERESYEAAELA